jgi:hypothetical protein
MEPVAFELRSRKIRVRKNDVMGFACGPQLRRAIDKLDADLDAKVSASDPAFPCFREWYGDEARYYGIEIHVGICALYWWGSRFGRPLDERGYEVMVAQLGKMLPAQLIDGYLMTGKAVVSEFIWWSASDIEFNPALMTAITEFREFYNAPKRWQLWRTRKRRRLAAAERRKIRAAHSALPDTA